MTLRGFVASALLVVILANTSLIAQSVDTRRTLANGTRIPVRLMHQISSATIKTGDPVNFEVVEDLVVDNEVVIKQGTPVRGVVVEAAAKRRMGRAGKLSYTLTETKSVDRQTIRLRATQDNKGDSNVTGVAVTTTAVAVFVPVAAPFFLLRKGKDITIPEGTRVDAFVDGDHALQAVASAAPVATTPATPQSSGPKLTNADVIGLSNAGLGDDVIVAKIESSGQSFILDAPDLLELKKAGLSDRLIAAMLQAARR